MLTLNNVTRQKMINGHIKNHIILCLIQCQKEENLELRKCNRWIHKMFALQNCITMF